MPKLSKEQRDALYLMYKYDGFMVIDHGASNARFGRGAGTERSPRLSIHDLAFLEEAELLTREFDYWQYQFTLTDKGRDMVEELQEAERMEARPPVDRQLVEEALEVLVEVKKRLDSGWKPGPLDITAFLEDHILLPVIGSLRRALDPDAQRSGQWQEIPDWAES